MIMRWNIEPYVGIGPLKFGMTQQQVGQILDPLHAVIATHPAYDGSINEHRALEIPACNYVSGALNELNFNWRVKDVLYGKIEIFNSDPRYLLQELEKINGGAKMDLGMILFDKLGIRTSGFYRSEDNHFHLLGSKVQDDRAVAVFRKGSFDAFIPGFEPISFLNML
jgi:hypothetical protein